MLRTAALALVGAGTLALPAGASAATAAFDKPCFVSGEAGQLVLSGFTPNAPVTVTNPELGPASVVADVTGSATLGFRQPGNFDGPGSSAFTMTATEDANPAQTATATGRIAPLAFATGTETTSPKALRRWTFSGFTPGKSIYAHFRFKGRTRGSFRFGKATGACGEYTRRAPGIAVKGRISTGTWVIQVDQKLTYSATAFPRVRASAPVFTRTRPRAAARAAGVPDTAGRAAAAAERAAAGAPRFGGWRP